MCRVLLASFTSHRFFNERVMNTLRSNSDVLLTMHLSIFTLVINQLDAQNLFYNKFISCLYMFRAPCAHRQEVKIVLYSIWYHHTYRWPSGAQVERGQVGMHALQPVLFVVCSVQSQTHSAHCTQHTYRSTTCCHITQFI